MSEDVKPAADVAGEEERPAHVLASSAIGSKGRNSAERRLRSARGHLDAVLRMLQDDRYCVDVLHQLAAVEGALARARQEILEAHARGCVVEALGGDAVAPAVDEVLAAVFGGRAPATREMRRAVP